MLKTIKKKPNVNSSVASGYTFIVLLIFTLLFSSKQLVSASCFSLDGQLGECVRFEECPSALILHQHGVNPGFCNLQENTVCCTDYRGSAQAGRLPHVGAQSSYFQKSPPGLPVSGTNTEDDSNSQRKKHSVAKPVGNYNHGKKKSNAEIIEEPYKFESPASYNTDYEVTNKPIRGSNRPSFQNEKGNFVPPGQAKKKVWREEKTTENDYFYEHNTKKPPRGPNRKSSSKRPGNNYETNSSSKRTESDNDWSEQGGKRSQAGNSHNSQNEYENGYSNKRTTPKRNNWGQGTFTSTRRPEINYAGNGDFHSSLTSTRKPQPSSSNFNTHRPNLLQPVPSTQDNDPNYSYGSSFTENRPSHSQGANFGGNRPNSRPKAPKRKTISEQKCEEYSKQVTKNITGLPLTTDPDPVIIPVRKCITPQQLIVGGENTTLGEFPHMAAIGFRDRNKKQISWNCGGTLISEQFVLTAGHCTSTSSGRPVKVRLGEYNLVKNDDGAYPVDYAIVEIITHPEYRPPSKYNDIALLKLSRKVTFFKHIRPACLYVQDTFSSSKAIATGWGRMNYDGGTSEILQKVVLSIVDNPTCDRLYKINVKTEVLARGIVDSQMCAGELTGGKDTCQGDSGGPLSITSTKCIHHVIGITSFGKSCALPNSTGVYTRVSAYISWIESVVWPTSYK